MQSCQVFTVTCKNEQLKENNRNILRILYITNGKTLPRTAAPSVSAASTCIASILE